MKSVVFYASHSGNTERAAAVIADALRAYGPVELVNVKTGPCALNDEVDLIVVGGPTEGHGMVPEIVQFLDSVPHHALAGRAAAAFDTRLNWPRWASGSAAAGIRQRLEMAGARTPVPTESFIVSMKPEISSPELERARAWASGLVSQLFAPLTT
jgi:flavodoxin